MSRIPNGVRVQSNKNPSVTFNALDNACAGRLNPQALKLWKDMLNVLQWEPDCRFRLEEERVAILDFLNNALQINATVLVYSSTSFIFDNSDTLILEGGEKGHLQDRAKISTYQEGRLTSKRVLIGLPDLVFALTGGDVEFGILAVTKDAFYVPDFIDRESGPEYGWGQSVEEISTETETKTEIKSQENKTMSNVKTTTVAVMAGIVLLTLVVLIGGFAGYRKLANPQTQITIAGKMGSEPEILINMYKDLIEHDHPNMQVSTKANFGGTSFLFKALKSGSIDIYPEFTGTVLESLIKGDKLASHNPAKTYQVAKNGLKSQYQMAYLKPMSYQNGYDLAVTKQFAKKYNLKTVSDLVAVEGKIHAGFDPDFYQLKDGYPGLRKAYGLNFASAKTMEPSIRYKAIANGKVNLVDGYTTDPEIREYHLVVLKDNKRFFPPYQGAPLMTEKLLTAHPELRTTLNKLAGKVSTTDMQQMNYKVTVKHEKAATVAREYLRSHGLLD